MAEARDPEVDHPDIVITPDDHPDLMAVLRHWLETRPDTIDYVEVEDSETGEVYRLEGETLRERFAVSNDIEGTVLEKLIISTSRPE